MILTAVQELEKKTFEYWRISQALNGRSKEMIPMGSAIAICNSIRFTTNPSRPIFRSNQELMAELISGESGPQHEGKVLSLKA